MSRKGNKKGVRLTRSRPFQLALKSAMIGFLILVFANEFITPLGFAHGLLYTPILGVSLLTRKRTWVVGIAITACCLTVLGILVSPPPHPAIPAAYVLANRLFSVLVIGGLGLVGSALLGKIVQQSRLNRALGESNRELGNQQRLLRIAGEVGHFGGWSVNLKSGRIRWSEQVAFIHGCEPGFSPSIEEGISFYAPEHQEQIMKAFNACATEGTPYDEELAILNKDGEQVWVRTVGRAVQDRMGRIVAVEGAIQDISGRKAIESTLASSEMRFRQLADSMPLIVWAADEKGEVDFFCQPLVDYTGVPMEVLSEPGYWVKHIHPDDVEETLKTWEYSISTGEPYSMEFRIRRHDGVYHWFLNQAVPIREPNGTITRWYGTSTDIQHQKDMEEEARDLARRVTTILESITDALLTVDREWRFTYVNRQAEKVIQRSRDEILGKVFWDEFPAAKGSEFEKQYVRALETGEPSRFEAYYAAPFDTWFDVIAYPSEDGLSIYFNDITARRKNEEELRLLHACIERLNDIVLIADSSRFETEGSRIVFVNKTFERKTGYTREEVIGKSPGMLQGPETDRETIEEIRAAIRKKKNIRKELRNYTKDGRPYWAEVDLVPVLDEKGNHNFIVAIERDISERKKAEDELFRSRHRLELILTSVGEGIHGLDTDGNILFENPAAARMFGWDCDSVVGRHSHSLIHHHRVDGTDYPAEECPIYQALKDGEPKRVNDEVFFRKDGSPFPVEYYACPMRDAEGIISGVVVTFRDVTEQRSLEEQLRQSQRLEAVGQLTGGMAHDFNNLLTVVQGNSDLLLEMIEAESPLYPLVEMISTASQRGADLTHRLLAFARRQALDPKPVDVNRLLQDLEPLLRRAIGEQYEIELVCGAGLWKALVDPVQLESALLNLTLNARDAMAQGGRLTIETANYWINREYANSHDEVLPGQYIQIAVSDTGTGIQPEDLGKVFEPFYTTKESGKGTGLGLSMVYGFVKQSRGHIKIYSEPGDGTTVKIYLPRLLDSGEHQVTQASVSSVESGNEVILLVEDDELVRHYAETCLASLGYRVITAENGKQALDIIQETDDINLLFTDIVMPGGMNGRQLADRAVEIRPDLKVLYTSGYTDNAIVHHGRLDPGAQLLGKPYGRADLARKIREVLELERS